MYHDIPSFNSVIISHQLSSQFELDLEVNSLDWNVNELEDELELEDMKPTWMGSNQLFVECRWEKEFAARKQSRWHTMVIAGTSRTIVLMERRWSGENRFALSSLSLAKDPYKNGRNTSYCSYPYGEDWKRSKDPMMHLLFGR